jgi:DNA replication protein
MKDINKITNIMDWKSLLIENYKQMGLNEKEVSIILIIDCIKKTGKCLVSPDLIALKSTLTVKEIDSINSDLMAKNVLTIEDGQFGLETSLAPLIDSLHKIFMEELLEEEKYKDKDRIFERLEATLGRPLSKYEMDTVKDWIAEGETYDSISGAIEIAVFANRRNISYIDDILAGYRMKKDMDREGISVASNNKWNSNLNATIELAKEDWVNSGTWDF